MASKRGQQRRRIGRPPAGAREGEKVKDYPQLSIRLPNEVKATLHALSVIISKPQWRVITDAIECFVAARSDSERRLIAELAGRSRHGASGERGRAEG